MDQIRADFDAIGLESERAGSRPLHPYEQALLELIPTGCDRVLEVGCGCGTLTALMAQRARHVLAIDLSREMIRVAESRSRELANVEYRLADVMTMELPAETFDVVVSVAALHHMPFDAALAILVSALRPGGRLLIQDIVARPGLRHVPINALALVVRLMRWGRLTSEVPAVARLYREHGARDRYLLPQEIETRFRRALPGARVLHHLEWRYTAVWDRPEVPAHNPPLRS